SLDQSNVSLDRLSTTWGSKIPQMKSQADQALPTVAQGWDKIKTSLEQVEETLADKLDIAGWELAFSRGLDLLRTDAAGFGRALVEMEVDVWQNKLPAIVAAGTNSALGILASWASSAKAYIASVLANLPTAPSTGTNFGGQFSIPTAGGLGGYGSGTNPYGGL